VALFSIEHLATQKRIFEGKIINLRVDTLAHPHGLTTEREIGEHKGGAVIAALPSAGSIILVKQYRYSVDEELIELPAGRIESGEEPLAAARRELREETGYRAFHWQELARFYSAPGFCTELLHLWQATELEFVGKRLDEDEATDVMVLALDEAWNLVVNGKVRDAKTVAALGLLSTR